MSVNISTTEYTKTRKAVIDGVEFEVRPMSSSESLTLTLLGQDFNTDDMTPESTKKALETIDKIFFSLFDKEKEARKVLGNLSFDAWFDIYNKIMSEGK